MNSAAYNSLSKQSVLKKDKKKRNNPNKKIKDFTFSSRKIKII